MKKVLKILKKVGFIVLMVALPLAFLAGVVWALDFTGVINFQKTAQKIPVVGKMIPGAEEKAPKKSPLQLENETLRNEKEELQKQLSEKEEDLKKKIDDLEHKWKVEQQKTKELSEQKQALQDTVDSLQTWKEEQEGQQLSYESLAKYYAEMKPDKAAKIMANLDNEVTLGILLNLENEQVTAIFSAMDPLKAAELSNLLRQ